MLLFLLRSHRSRHPTKAIGIRMLLVFWYLLPASSFGDTAGKCTNVYWTGTSLPKVSPGSRQFVLRALRCGAWKACQHSSKPKDDGVLGKTWASASGDLSSDWPCPEITSSSYNHDSVKKWVPPTIGSFHLESFSTSMITWRRGSLFFRNWFFFRFCRIHTANLENSISIITERKIILNEVGMF